MKITKTFFLIIVSVCLFSACKKEKDESPVAETVPPVSYDNYGNFKVGNYWIYQIYTVDSLGNGTATSNYDSCYVEKDTAINGNTYHKWVKDSPGTYPGFAVYFLRDSLSYLVDQLGRVLFSSEDFTTVFNLHYAINPPPLSDTIYVKSSKMYSESGLTVVPAGSFSVLNYKTTYIMHYPYNGGGIIRYQNRRYAKDIGLVSETLDFYSSSPVYQERRLVRYHFE